MPPRDTRTVSDVEREKSKKTTRRRPTPPPPSRDAVIWATGQRIMPWDFKPPTPKPPRDFPEKRPLPARPTVIPFKPGKEPLVGLVKDPKTGRIGVSQPKIPTRKGGIRDATPVELAAIDRAARSALTEQAAERRRTLAERSLFNQQARRQFARTMTRPELEQLARARTLPEDARTQRARAAAAEFNRGIGGAVRGAVRGYVGRLGEELDWGVEQAARGLGAGVRDLGGLLLDPEQQAELAQFTGESMETASMLAERGTEYLARGAGRETQRMGIADNIPDPIKNTLKATARTTLETLVGIGPGLFYTAADPVRAWEETKDFYKLYYGALQRGDFSVLEEYGLTPIIADALTAGGVGFGAVGRLGALRATRRGMRGVGGDLVRGAGGAQISPLEAYGRAALFRQEPTTLVTGTRTMGRAVPRAEVTRPGPVPRGEALRAGDVVEVEQGGKRRKVVVSNKNKLAGQEAPGPNDPVDTQLNGKPATIVSARRQRPFEQRFVPRSQFGQWLSNLYWGVRPTTKGVRQRKLGEAIEMERDRQTAALRSFAYTYRSIQRDVGQSTAFDRMLRAADPEQAIKAEIANRHQRGEDRTREQQQTVAALEQALEHVQNPSQDLLNAVEAARGLIDETEAHLIRRGQLTPETAAQAKQAFQRWLAQGHLLDPVEDLASPTRDAISDELADVFSPERDPELGFSQHDLALGLVDAYARARAAESGVDAGGVYDELFSSVERLPTDEFLDRLVDAEEDARVALTEIRDMKVEFPEKKVRANYGRAMRAITGKARNPAKNERVYRNWPPGRKGGTRIQIIGPISPKNWSKQAKVILSDPEILRRAGIAALGRPFKTSKEAIDYYARWYEAYDALFREVFRGEGVLDADSVMRGFAVSQANASPTSGLQAVLRVADKIRRGETVGEKEISVVAQGIETAMRGNVIDKYVAAKLSDFIDSLRGKRTRTWMGDAPEAGAPAAIDVHAARNLGRVDKKLTNRLRDRWNITDPTLDNKSGVPGTVAYETMSVEYADITDHLNRSRFNGRQGWNPAQAQALGWAVVQLLHGTIPEDLGTAVRQNTMEVQLQVTKGRNSFGGDLSGAEASAVIARIRPDIEALVDNHGGVLTDLRVEIGGWLDGTEATAQVQVVGSPETIRNIVNDLAVLYDQEEVIATRPGGATKDSRLAVEIFHPTFANTGVVDGFWRNVRASITTQRQRDQLQGFQKFTDRQGRHGIRIITTSGALKLDSRPGDSKYDAADKWINPVIDKAARDSELDVEYELGNATIIRSDAWSDAESEGRPHGLGSRGGLDDPAVGAAQQRLLDAVADVRGGRPAATAPGGVPGSGVVSGEPRVLEDALRSRAGDDLQGLPTRVTIPGHDAPIEWASNRDLQQLAVRIAEESGIPYTPIRRYLKVDPERAQRIARAFDEMEHAPNDPEVRAAYRAFLDETLVQYRALEQAGYHFEFMPPGADPYAASPRLAQLDLTENRHLYVFSTEDGFGLDPISDAERAANPMLEDTGIRWGGKPVLYNDLFRAVHDVFGHFKEGVGFRADGEENAWRSHSAMYSPEARRAMTTETRGQNSWVNYGPYGAYNRQARTHETTFADQKLGLLPEWVVTEGAEDPPPGALREERKIRPDLSYETRPYGAVLLDRHGAEVLLDEDYADLGTWTHEAAHVLWDNALRGAQASGDVRADLILERFGLETLEPSDMDAHETLARTLVAWVKQGALPSPQLRMLFDGLSEALREAYGSGIGPVARHKEEADLIREMLKDPVVTSFLRDMFDVAPYKQFDPGVHFLTMQNLSRFRRPGRRMPTRFKASVLPERETNETVKQNLRMINFSEGRIDVGPEVVVSYGLHEIRGRVQDAQAERVREFAEPLEIVDGVPVRKEGYQVWNVGAVRGAQRKIDEAAVRADRYDGILHQEPEDFAEEVAAEVADAFNEDVIHDSVEGAAARIGNTFLDDVRAGRVLQVPDDVVEAFLGATGGAQLLGKIGTLLQIVANILRVPNMLARWKMIGKVAYPVINAAATATLVGMNQGPALALNLKRNIQMSKATRVRLLSEVGVGVSDLVAAATRPQGFWQKEEATFSAAMRVLSSPEGWIRLTQIDNELAASGYRTESDIIGLLDLALKIDTPEGRQARDFLNQVGRFAEEAVVRFRGQTPEEQLVTRQMIFVYGWLRAAARFTLQFPLNRPVTAGVLYHVGQYGWERLQEDFFALAREQQGAVPVGYRKDGEDYLVKLLDVSQALPFKSGTDILRPFLGFMGLEDGGLRPASIADLLSPGAESGLRALYGTDRFGTGFVEGMIKEVVDPRQWPLAYWGARFVDPSLTGTKLRADRDRANILLNLFFGMAAPYEIRAKESYKRWLDQQPDAIRNVVRYSNEATQYADLAKQAFRVEGAELDEETIRAINADAGYQIFWRGLQDRLQEREGDSDRRLTPVERAASKARMLKEFFPEYYESGVAGTQGLDVGDEYEAQAFVKTWDDLWTTATEPKRKAGDFIERVLGVKPDATKALPAPRWRRDLAWLKTAPPESRSRLSKQIRDQGLTAENRGPIMSLIEREMERLLTG